jgi:hypothetical protein
MRRFNIEMVTPKLIYKFNVIPIRISADIFVETDKLILKFVRNSKDEDNTFSSGWS